MRKLRNTEVQQWPEGTNLVEEDWNPGNQAPEPMFLTTMLEWCIPPLGFLYQERMGENEEAWKIEYQMPICQLMSLFLKWNDEVKQELQKFSKGSEGKVKNYSFIGLKYKFIICRVYKLVPQPLKTQLVFFSLQSVLSFTTQIHVNNHKLLLLTWREFEQSRDKSNYLGILKLPTS